MSDFLSIEATIKKIFETVQITEKFQKREFIAETGDQYPQLIKFELTQDKTNLLDDIKRQVKAKIFFNLRGREFQNKEGKTAYFNSLNVWKIQILDDETDQNQTQINAKVEAMPDPVIKSTDDLPF